MKLSRQCTLPCVSSSTTAGLIFLWPGFALNFCVASRFISDKNPERCQAAESAGPAARQKFELVVNRGNPAKPLGPHLAAIGSSPAPTRLIELMRRKLFPQLFLGGAAILAASAQLLPPRTRAIPASAVFDTFFFGPFFSTSPKKRNPLVRPSVTALLRGRWGFRWGSREEYPDRLPALGGRGQLSRSYAARTGPLCRRTYPCRRLAGSAPLATQPDSARIPIVIS